MGSHPTCAKHILCVISNYQMVAGSNQTAQYSLPHINSLLQFGNLNSNLICFYYDRNPKIFNKDSFNLASLYHEMCSCHAHQTGKPDRRDYQQSNFCSN